LEKASVLAAAYLHPGAKCDCSAMACVACLKGYFTTIITGACTLPCLGAKN
jgi:hypothetical protein